MNGLVSKGFPKSRSAYLTGIAKFIIDQRRKREPQYDADLDLERPLAISSVIASHLSL